MASEQFQPLLTLDRFRGIDYTTAPFEVEPGRGVQAINANCQRKPGALLPERGRVQVGDFDLSVGTISVVFPVVTIGDQPLYLVQGNIGSAYIDPATLAVLPIPGLLAFDQAVQYSSVIYTNAGQRLFVDDYPGATNPATGLIDAPLMPYQWQYPIAPPFTGSATPTTGTGNMDPATYFYVFTQTTNMPDGSVSETSPSPSQYATPLQVTLSATGEITLTPQAGYTFIGNNADGTAYTTNIYRQSSNQAGYLFVGNAPSNAPYVDTQSDAQIIGNAELIVHRDPPPVSETNLGALVIHKNRVWTFVTQDNADTLNQPQIQLWYSNVDRPWEFDDTSQVLLMQSDVAVPPSGGVYQYNGLYGNEPRGLGKTGTVLVAFTIRETWAVYGDDQSTFVQRELFNIGCTSRHSITMAGGGVFWLSEQGPYFFSGAAPSNTGERLRDQIRPLPAPPGFGSTGIPVSAQAQAAGSFANLTWYLSFPTLNQTYGYHTTSQEWLGVLPYAPTTTAGIATLASAPVQYGGVEYGLVIAARASGLDYWFADPSFDLGFPQSWSWVGPISDSQQPASEKQYRWLSLQVPPGTQGSAAVTLTVDGQDPYSWTIPDLSLYTRHMTSLGFDGGNIRGFSASLAVSLQGLAGQPPPNLYRVVCWGQVPADRFLVPRT